MKKEGLSFLALVVIVFLLIQYKVTGIEKFERGIVIYIDTDIFVDQNIYVYYNDLILRTDIKIIDDAYIIAKIYEHDEIEDKPIDYFEKVELHIPQEIWNSQQTPSDGCLGTSLLCILILTGLITTKIKGGK